MYLFQTTSGMKLATRTAKNAPQYTLQLKVTIPSTFSSPMAASTGKTTPSMMQCTRPQRRALRAHASPIHNVTTAHSAPAAGNERTPRARSSDAPIATQAGTHHNHTHDGGRSKSDVSPMARVG